MTHISVRGGVILNALYEIGRSIALRRSFFFVLA